MISEEELRRRYPEIPWDLPVPIHVPLSRVPSYFVCRYCIAMYGLKAQALIAEEVAYASRRRNDVLVHIGEEHTS